MRIYQFDAKAAGRRVDRFESKQLTISHLLKGDHLQVVCVYLGSGGVIGRHPSVGHQFFFVVEGSGVVAGANGEEREIHPGAGC